MRRGEVLGVRRDDVHFDTGRIETAQALIAVGYQLEFADSSPGPVAATLDADTLALLADWRREQAAQLASAGAINEHALVFTRPDGQPLHPHSVSQAFARA